MGDIVIRGDGVQELSVSDVHGQVQKIQALMQAVMKEGDHYGVIPGTNKPSLYKAGAEKIGVLFRLAPEFIVERTDLPNGHREFQVLCKLTHMGSGVMVGQGVGSCSTMESKYRWRNQDTTEEMGPVPKEYWDAPKDDRAQREKVLADLYGPGKYRTKKVDGNWTVLKVTGDGERMENPDIADQYNTVLKMAKKRAFVDATITATAASDFFTQDVEDMPEFGGKVSPPDAPVVNRADVIRTIEAMKANLSEAHLAELKEMLKMAGDNSRMLDAVLDRAQEMAAAKAGDF